MSDSGRTWKTKGTGLDEYVVIRHSSNLRTDIGMGPPEAPTFITHIDPQGNAVTVGPESPNYSILRSQMSSAAKAPDAQAAIGNKPYEEVDVVVGGEPSQALKEAEKLVKKPGVQGVRSGPAKDFLSLPPFNYKP